MRERTVLIAGGGLGGLATAACLLTQGIDVEVHEQAPQLGEVGAGIQVSANATRVFRHLGLLDALDAVAARPDVYQFRLFDTGEILQSIPLGQSYVERHGVPYFSIHRADLLNILVDKVRSLKPDAIHLNAKAVGYEEGADGVTLLLEGGRQVRGDALIGADGIRSAIRAQLLGQTPANYTGDIAWRAVVEKSVLPEEYQTNAVDIWVGPARHAVTYPLRRGTLTNFVGSVEDDSWKDDSWTVKRPWEEMQRDFTGWHGMIQALIDAADRDSCYRWALNNRLPVENWSSGHTVLMGDAAHPTLPYMAQGAAMAFEDAAVLARAFTAESTVSDAIALFQRNRIPRTTRIVTESSANRKLFHMPSMEEMKASFSQRNMNAERNAWLFSYDPLAVELV